MPFKKFFIPICFSFLISGFFISAVYADEAASDAPVYRFMPDLGLTKAVTREDIYKYRPRLYEFAHRVFFSDHLPDCLSVRLGIYGCAGGLQRTTKLPYKEEERFKEIYPYFYPLVFRETTDVPDFPAINKWVKPARISFAITRQGENPFMEDAEGMHQSLQRTITPLLPHISETVKRINETVKPIVDKDMLHFDADAYTYQEAEGQGRIHIMFFTNRSAYERSQFLKRSKMEIQYHTTIPEKTEEEPKVYLELDRHMPYPVPFTPQSEKQVEGHFFTNPQNEIQAAVCYIPTFVTQELQAHLIDECLLRSMGMPDPASSLERLNNQPIFMLGYWHDLDKWSFQRQAHLKRGELAAFSGMTDVDLLLLKILYQPEVTPGMTIKQFFQLFNDIEPAAKAPAAPQ